jgi:tRNA-Thr(GGU) m(6)t(6)A37 methyltransferase TsaA
MVRPIGRVESTLVDLDQAPCQGDEGAPDAWLVFDPAVAEAMQDLRVGDEVLVLTWLDRADRTIQVVYPRGDQTRARQGVFSTRSPHRPNPLGLHRVKVIQVDGLRVYVSDLEAINGTPIIDVKPVLSGER